MLFGWLSGGPSETRSVLSSMASALRVTSDERITTWSSGTFGIGIVERPFGDDDSRMPARAADGTQLWMSGEAFDWPSHGGIRNAGESRTAEFRTRLLDAINARGTAAIADLDGEYQIAVWNPHHRSLTLLNDRFGALPLYIGSSPHGTAFGGGVRGVLVAPGISLEPDTEAIREAVSFGGYRLGSRTNVRDVWMIPPATTTTVTLGKVTQKRYWTWSELQDGDATDALGLRDDAHRRWRASIGKRLDGSRRPGLTLSGGLDSRAILAEASHHERPVSALTYGVPCADDVRIAQRAARAVGATWELFPLYTEGWLERRTNRIHETDGLMDLVDLMHTEVLERLPSLFDVYLSGYIGDVVAGSTWFFENRAEDLLGTLPYYGGPLGMSFDEAVIKAEELIARTPGAPRFAAYEHKAPQSTNRITAAARPYITVRRPFVDYAFFEVCQRQSPQWRARHGWREQWLLSSYPELFARIPNQQTGVPPGSSRARWHATRVARFGWRRVLRAARAAGLPVNVPDRSFHPDERFWSRPAERSRIEGTILRGQSISCDVFGRARVQSVLRDFFERGAAPVQVIGALYVFEHYHQTLAASLSGARSAPREHACSFGQH